MNSIRHQIDQYSPQGRAVLLGVGLLLIVVSYLICFIQPVVHAQLRIQGQIDDASRVIQLAQSQHLQPTQFITTADLTDVHTLSAQLHDAASQWTGVQVASVQTIRRQPITAIAHTDRQDALAETAVYMRDVEAMITGDAFALMQYLHTLEHAEHVPIFWQSIAYHAEAYPSANVRVVLRIMESA